MNLEIFDRQAVIKLCCGNEVAIQWLQLGRRYVHLIDDVIDEDIPQANQARGAERICEIGALAIDLYTHPFFLANREALAQAMMTNTNSYADSVAWEKSGTKWKRDFSDWARHGWVEVALVVASICGGYRHMRAMSQELRTVCYMDHHKPDTTPI